MKCVEKYRVNKDGFSEMMSLLLPVPARDSLLVRQPSGCSASWNGFWCEVLNFHLPPQVAF
jgi:hypothetical protein